MVVMKTIYAQLPILHGRDPVAYGEGERYGGALCHPSTPGIPAAQAVALFECAEPKGNRRLFGLSTCASLCPRDAGRDHPRPQKLRGPDARGAPGRALSRPVADDILGCGCLDRGRVPSP